MKKYRAHSMILILVLPRAHVDKNENMKKSSFVGKNYISPG